MPTITYNIPPAVTADMLDALRLKYELPNATPQELQAEVERQFKQSLVIAYREYMRKKKYDVVLD